MLSPITIIIIINLCLIIIYHMYHFMYVQKKVPHRFRGEVLQWKVRGIILLFLVSLTRKKRVSPSIIIMYLCKCATDCLALGNFDLFAFVNMDVLIIIIINHR
ncbi:hypothetical protein BDA99DRAFT_525191 [Phascolomyces articulosus]|uniref:Uncharacterized protein n=1 Tax=Phascolomyces articulosus TaxID=60185 RepID=A0AAD5JQ04_9FUNG|nr:hypothetical protein BDA99DRAFT_525191 [Phascolomyces articulosus]